VNKSRVGEKIESSIEAAEMINQGFPMQARVSDLHDARVKECMEQHLRLSSIIPDYCHTVLPIVGNIEKLLRRNEVRPASRESSLPPAPTEMPLFNKARNIGIFKFHFPPPRKRKRA
jgi:hypothetical protein